jgi:hypothetical protein
MPSNRRCLRLWASAVLLAAPACPDPDARYEDFIERTADVRGRDAGPIEGGQRFDFSGSYLLALSTTLSPDQPILFGCEVSVAADLATLDLSIQALTTDDADAPREPTGEPIMANAITYEEDGSFSVDFGEVRVPPDANPISGAEIVADVGIDATVFEMTAELPNFFCGGARGMVSAPLMLDLEGSTFGAVETDDLAGEDPLLHCP